jgi:hypothetical protein
MSDSSVSAPRPVSLIAIVAILASFALFLVPIRLFYLRHLSPPAQSEAPEKLTKDLEWKATPETRRAYLTDLVARQQKQAASYAWVDKKAGIVQVPVERAMELVIQDYAAKK